MGWVRKGSQGEALRVACKGSGRRQPPPGELKIAEERVSSRDEAYHPQQIACRLTAGLATAEPTQGRRPRIHRQFKPCQYPAMNGPVGVGPQATTQGCPISQPLARQQVHG
jgi:hypothetical protein